MSLGTGLAQFGKDFPFVNRLISSSSETFIENFASIVVDVAKMVALVNIEL